MALGWKAWSACLMAGLGGVALLAAPARGERFVQMGPRQKAMGGAGVGASDDATSIYWNPANLSLLPLGRKPAAPESAPVAKADVFDGTDAPASRTLTAEEEARLTEKEQKPAAEETPAKRDKWDGFATTQIQIVASVDLKLTGDIVSRLDRLEQLYETADLEGAFERANNVPPTLSTADYQNLASLYEQIVTLDRGGDLLVDAGAGLLGRMKGFGIGVYSQLHAGVRTRIDRSNFGVADAQTANDIGNVLTAQAPGTAPTTAEGQQLRQELLAAIPGLTLANANTLAGLAEQSGVNLQDPLIRDALTLGAQLAGTAADGGLPTNRSGALGRAIATQEVALGLSWDFLEERISIGVSPKLMNGITFIREVTVEEVVNDDLDFNNIYEDYSRNSESTITFGIDAGISIQPFDGLRLGLVGRNLNQPEFDFKGGGKYKLRPQLRAGVALSPFEGLTLAVDGDVLVNKTDTLPGYRSRQVGGGLEFAPDFGLVSLAFRGGCYVDVEDEQDEFNPVLTAGVGVRIAVVTLDVAGSMSLRRETYDGYDVPSDAGVSVMLGVSF